MIQRIQTLYLVFLITFQLLATQLTIFSFTTLSKSVDLKFTGLYSNTGILIVSEIKLLLMAILVAMTSIITIIYFKKRIIQLKLVKIALLLLTAQLGLSIKFFTETYQKYGNDFSFGLSFYCLLACYFFAFLAIKAINKDENLIKSVDRIR